MQIQLHYWIYTHIYWIAILLLMMDTKSLPNICLFISSVGTCAWLCYLCVLSGYLCPCAHSQRQSQYLFLIFSRQGLWLNLELGSHQPGPGSFYLCPIEFSNACSSFSFCPNISIRLQVHTWLSINMRAVTQIPTLMEQALLSFWAISLVKSQYCAYH